jgi:F-type H+-transporting ATPase subunit b
VDQVIKIDINLVFTIINLLVLYLLMKKFLFGPIIKVMDVRKAMIDQQFAGAKEQEDQAKALKEQYEGALKSAREESFQIMEQARKEAKAQADITVEDTQAKVSAMLAKAQEDINTERENAMRQMKDDVASLAMEAAGKIIGKNSGADQDLSLYDQFIEKAGDPDDSDRR